MRKSRGCRDVETDSDGGDKDPRESQVVPPVTPSNIKGYPTFPLEDCPYVRLFVREMVYLLPVYHYEELIKVSRRRTLGSGYQNIYQIECWVRVYPVETGSPTGTDVDVQDTQGLILLLSREK